MDAVLPAAVSEGRRVQLQARAGQLPHGQRSVPNCSPSQERRGRHDAGWRPPHLIDFDTGMLVHAYRQQLHRLPRLSAVCFRALAAPAECPVGESEEKTGPGIANTKDDRFIDKVAHTLSTL